MQSLYRRTLLAAAAGLTLAAQIGIAQAQKKDIVVGVIYDYTGPFAAGGLKPVIGRGQRGAVE